MPIDSASRFFPQAYHLLEAWNTDTDISSRYANVICLRRLIWISLLLLLYPFTETYGQGEDLSENNPISCECVAFRLDDVQDYYLNRAQMEIIGAFEQRNASLTIGVIGNYIGEDAVLVQFLHDKIRSDRFTLDVANHGWNHEDFSLLTKQEQTDLLSKSNGKIKVHLGVSPTVFIAPFNRLNEDTLFAMAENDLHIVSANVTHNHGPFLRNATGGDDFFYHFPATAKTGDLNADDTQWIGASHDVTMGEIETSLDRYGYAVVMMHPQEFSVRDGTAFQNAVDIDQLAELKLLLDNVRAQGYEIVTISEFPRHVTVPEFSSYVMLAVAVSFIALLIFAPHGMRTARFRT
jgi:peptidoglycan/xylan/chitin deacetylase (PgdA/CDA1 family)